jgi:hypothetical protein
MSTEPLFVSGWEVAGVSSAEKFFPTLTETLPLPVNLCFEGTRISPDVQVLLASSAVTPSLQIPPGTIWPKPSVFHVRATEQFLHQLGALAGKHAESEICDHFHAYADGHGLMQWYDAFDLPLLIDESIAEANVQNFCRKLGGRYARWHAAK